MRSDCYMGTGFIGVMTMFQTETEGVVAQPCDDEKKATERVA